MDPILSVAEVGLVTLLVLNGALLLYVMIHRSVDRLRNRLLSKRRSRYEEAAALLAADDLGSLTLARQVKKRDHRLVEQLLLGYAERFAGEVRQHLAEAFAGIGAVARNRARCRSRWWWVRADAARRLGLMGDPYVGRFLHPLLSDPHVEVRLAAARALVDLGSNAWLDELIASLTQPDLFSGLRVADVILDAGPAAIPSLVRFAQSASDARAVALAIEILGDMRALQATAVISEALRTSPSKEVRAAACRALGLIEDPAAMPDLCAALQSPDWEVQGQAVRALGRIGDPAALPLLLPLLDQPSPWVVYQAAVALDQMGPVGRAAMNEVLDQPTETELAARRHEILREVLSLESREE